MAGRCGHEGWSISEGGVVEELPHMPCSPATNTRAEAVGPMGGPRNWTASSIRTESSVKIFGSPLSGSLAYFYALP
jgi:hypothetical protein